MYTGITPTEYCEAAAAAKAVKDVKCTAGDPSHFHPATGNLDTAAAAEIIKRQNYWPTSKA